MGFTKNGWDKCIHHWVIGVPEGRYSDGKCVKCGERREDFRNSFDEQAHYWQRRQGGINEGHGKDPE